MRSKDFIVVFLLITSCIDPYDAGTLSYENKLVIEGLLTNETKQHQITVSRTAGVNEPKFIPEPNAIVVLKTNDGSSITLTETSPGIYKTPYMSGVIGTGYTLTVTTSGGSQFSSKEVIMKATPPVDKIYAQYIVDNPNLGPGIQIYVDSKDPLGKTHYYRWEYESTYEIKTPFPSKFVWLGGNKITIRTVQVDNCWATDSSKSILIQSTLGFTEDKVTAFPIRFIPAVSPDLVVKYSILVKQYAMNEDSYRFWKQQQEINEQQGSLFDAQPGKVTGNISSTGGPENEVLGYFDASAVTYRRAFFTPRQFVSSGYIPPIYLQSCVETAPLTIPISKLGETLEQNKNILIIADAGGDGPDVIFLMRIACCDCTSRGTNLKPSYWE